MRTLFLIFFLFIPLLSFAQARIELAFHYYGKNIYVQNPVAASGAGFCTDSVTVNGKRYPQEKLNSSAFEIQLDTMGFQPQDSLAVYIYHKPGCKPKILNTDPLPLSRVIFISVKISDDGVLRWSTVNDPAGIRPDFYVQQFRWGTWRKLGEVNQKSGRENSYEFPVKFHSGQNKFRVAYSRGRPYGQFIYSPADSITSTVAPVTMTYDSLAKKIRFSTVTDYELTSPEEKHGTVILLRGSGDYADLREIKKGGYFIRFDNEIRKIKIGKR
ncbi:MAG: hypothetical protein FD123_808 [Bacteroidetes bacterium]|nr:MAG: hypothetical protein FD123_808 [Bacteroidota bacterium]